MSAIKLQNETELDHELFDAKALEEHERRRDVDSKRRDRRVIERMGNPELRKFLRFSKNLCNVGVGSSAVFVAVLIGRHIHTSNLELNRSIFFGFVVSVIAFALYYLSTSIQSYIENESRARLVVVSERLFHTLFLFVCTGFVLGASYLLTLF